MDRNAEEKSTKESEVSAQGTMERNFLEEYLQNQGYCLRDLCKLPEEEMRRLMTEACRYASLKMAQIESSTHFRESIRWPY